MMSHRVCLGKIPGLGDFVSRGMPSATAASWFDALAKAMLEGQTRHGTAWRSFFLNASALGFHTPGCTQLAGPASGLWLGTVLPSVDKVGRLFPWLVMEHHTGPLNYGDLHRRLLQCFDTGITAIRDDWEAPQLDALFSGSTSASTGQPLPGGPWQLWSLDHQQSPRELGKVASVWDWPWP